MAAWEGFTDAELEKIQKSTNSSGKFSRKENKPRFAKPVSKKTTAANSVLNKSKQHIVSCFLRLYIFC